MSTKVIILTIFSLFFTTSISASEELVIEIDNPKFSEKGLNDKIYEIKAKKGLKLDDELELFTVEGKFKSENNGKWIYLEAEKGSFSQITNFIELEKNIIFYTDEGEKVTSSFATFDMTDDIIELNENVSHQTNDGIILSDKSIITNNFSKISYIGNVVSTFYNTK